MDFNCNRTQWRIQDLQTGAKDEAPRSSAVGVRIETPQAPRGVGCGDGVSRRGDAPHPDFFDFGSQNGDFSCILGTIFTVQLGLFGLNAKASSRW